MVALSTEEISRLFQVLNEELRQAGVRGQLHVAGGAVMCLAYNARPSTRDVDAVFEPSVAVLDAALRVAEREELPDTWLNNAVKGYLRDTGTFNRFLDLDHLRVFVADTKYMLAMKCLAFRTGEGYHDEADVRHLVRHLDLRSYDDAARILAAYYPLDRFPAHALAALREILQTR